MKEWAIFFQTVLQAWSVGGHRPVTACIATGKAPQIIETNLWLRQTCQLMLCLRVDIAKQTIAETFAGDRAQLFLDPLDHFRDIGIAGFGADLKGNRMHAGKPAHGTREVQILADGFASMAFEVDQYRSGSPAHLRDGQGEGGQQNVVESSMERCGDGGEQARR